MAKRSTRGPKTKQVESLTHDAAKRRNVPTAELASAFERMEDAEPAGPGTSPRARPLAEGATRLMIAIGTKSARSARSAMRAEVLRKVFMVESFSVRGNAALQTVRTNATSPVSRRRITHALP